MDDKIRCGWCKNDALYQEYHDTEWGVAVRDDQKMFEFLILETFQAGLSWITILRKREHFAAAFANFDCQKVAKFDENKIQELMLDAGIVRNQLKIRAAVGNAIAFIKIQETEGSFSKYLWQFVDNKPVVNNPKTLQEVPATSEISDAISKDLKKRGFKFVGSTVMYAHLQATGLINDHLVDCWKK